MFPSLARIDAPNNEVTLRSMYPQFPTRNTANAVSATSAPGLFGNLVIRICTFRPKLPFSISTDMLSIVVSAVVAALIDVGR